MTKAQPSLGLRRHEIKTAAPILKILGQIAVLAGVTNPNDREEFCEYVFSIIMTHDKIDLRKRRALLKAERAVQTARKAILALDRRDQAILRRAYFDTTVESRFIRSRIWNCALEDLLWAFSGLTGSNPFPAAHNGRGRPKGTVANWQLQKLVEILWETAKLNGGNLYADHKRDDGGTMIKALELLRPVLPESLLPRILAAPTIGFIIKNFKASGRTWF